MDEILETIKTTDDRDELIHAIDEYEDMQYLSDEKEEKEFSKLKHTYKDLLKMYTSTTNSTSSLAELKVRLNQLEVVRLVLSFEPEESTVRSISLWVRDNFDRNALIQIGTKKSIGAGVVVSYKGKYGSFTIEDKLDEYFDRNKDVLIGKIKS